MEELGLAESMIYLFIALIVQIVFGVICKNVSAKREMEGGFWWGFFFGVLGIIIVAVKPSDNKALFQSYYSFANGEPLFYCNACKNVFSRTPENSLECCPKCGGSVIETTILREYWRSTTNQRRNDLLTAFAKGEFLRKTSFYDTKYKNVSNADEIKKYKSLLDDGVITQEEFEAKKKQLLEQ